MAKSATPASISKGLSRAETARFLVRSNYRLLAMCRELVDPGNLETVAFLDFHQRLLDEAVRQGLLPYVPIAKGTPLGDKLGAF
jgi:hypothetical protein